uniref:MADF domain-containing protein n=1 Tax=Timema bartmani TaxID=61472 RepID=A0A7R9I523_9NEOP|nr:unnamed protein product [Timema bartmani]
MVGKLVFNPEEDEILLEKISKFPYIYNKKFPDFKNNTALRNAWKEIAHKVGRKGLIVGAIIRYTGSTSTVFHMLVVPEPASKYNLSLPPDTLWLHFSNKVGGVTPTSNKTYAYTFRGEIVDVEDNEIDLKCDRLPSTRDELDTDLPFKPVKDPTYVEFTLTTRRASYFLPDALLYRELLSVLLLRHVTPEVLVAVLLDVQMEDEEDNISKDDKRKDSGQKRRRKNKKQLKTTIKKLQNRLKITEKRMARYRQQLHRSNNKTVTEKDKTPRKLLKSLLAGQKAVDPHEEFTVSFLKNSFGEKFVFPEKEDISVIDMSDIVQVLNPPTINKRGQHMFHKIKT